MNKWKDLSIQDKAKYIRESVRNGIFSLGEIRDIFENGGNLHALGDYMENGETVSPNDTTTIRAFNWYPKVDIGPNLPQRKQFKLNDNFKRLEFYTNINEDVDAAKDFYLDKGYNTYVANNNYEKIYNVGPYPYTNYMNPNSKLSLGRTVYDNLSNTFTDTQKLAAMANSYHESAGWTTENQEGGNAVGLFQFEPSTLAKYNTWLSNNSLTDSKENQVKYVSHLFETADSELKTPWDRIDTNVLNVVNDERAKQNKSRFRTINDLKDYLRTTTEEDARRLNVNSAWQHRNYTTEQALNDWNSGDLNLAIKGFEALFERAGKPQMDKRYNVGRILRKAYDLDWFTPREYVNKEDNLMD